MKKVVSSGELTTLGVESYNQFTTAATKRLLLAAPPFEALDEH